MTDYTHWHVGMKVVCVDADPSKFNGRLPCGWQYKDNDWPIKSGVVYSVSSIYRDPHENVICVTLDGIWRDPYDMAMYGISNLGFAAARFRPVISRPTDISIFTAMLTGAKERERA